MGDRSLPSSDPGDSAENRAPDAAAIIASALDAIVVIDRGNVIREFNPAAERIFGWSRAEVLGRDLGLLIPEDLRERHRAGLDSHVRTGQAKVLDRRLELEALRADGTRFPVELSVSRLGTWESPLFTAFIRDITVRRDLASTLLERSARLRSLVESQRELAGLSVTAEQLYDRIARIAHVAMGADGAAFEVPEGDHLVFRATSGAADGAHGLRLPILGSLSGETLRTGRTLICEDARTDPRVDADACAAMALRSMVVAVLRDSDGSVGVVKVMSTRPARFGPDDAAALEAFVASLAGVLSRIRRQAAAEAAAERGSVIVRIQERLAASDAGAQGLMEEICLGAILVTGADGATVELRAGDEMIYAAGGGCLVNQTGLRLPLNGSLSGLAVQLGTLLLSGDTSDDPRVNAQACLRVGARSMVVAPLYGEKGVIGVLKVISREPNAFDDQAVASLKDLAHTLGLLVERRSAAERIAESERRYRMLFAQNPHPMWVYDMESLRFVEVNAAATATYGFSREQFLSMTILDIRPEEDREAVSAFLEHIRTIAGPSHNYSARHRRRDGELIDVEISADDIQIDGRRARLVLAHDVTARRRAERASARAERALRMLSRSNADVIEANEEGALLEAVCRTVIEVGGYASAFVGLYEPGSRARFDIVRSIGLAGAELAAGFESFDASARPGLIVAPLSDLPAAVADPGLREGLVSAVVVRLRAPDGVDGLLVMFSAAEEALQADEASLLRDLASNLSRGLETIRADRERRRIAAALAFAASHDGTTGLERYMLLQPRIDAQLGRGEPLALLLVELDRFAGINQTLSHEAADEVLRQIGSRLALAAEDGVEVAHLAGDEFVLVSPSASTDAVGRLAERIRQDVADPIEVQGVRIRLTATIGIALAPDHGVSAVELLRRAEAAAERGKALGRDCVSWFSAEAMQALDDRILLGGLLRKAIDRNELSLVYQPQFRAGDSTPIGFEALLRWSSPVLGEVSPARFIPVAENLGLMGEVGDWVVWAACRQIRQWLDSGLSDFKVAVNVSSLQLQRPGLVGTVCNALAGCQVPGSYLELEITESALMQNLERARRKLERIAKLGVSVSLDDFGTGYSSLAYLKMLHLDKLKIDKSFVNGLPHDARDAAMARTIVSIAHQFGLSVAAEGVERREQSDFLAEIGCDLLQGFLLGRPMRPSDAALLLRRSTSGA